MTLSPEAWTLLLPFRSAEPNHTLRVGVVVPARSIPWMDAMLSFLRGTPGLEIGVFTADALPSSRRSSWLTDRVYSASRAKFDPFGTPDQHGSIVSSALLDRIQAAGSDVLLWLADSADLGTAFAQVAKYGIFSIRFGERNQAIPFWDEVANGRVSSRITVFWHDGTLAQGRAVRQAETSTLQGLFVTLNAGEPLVAAMRMLAGLCLDIRKDAADCIQKLLRLPIEPMGNGQPSAYPSTFEAARFTASKLTRSALLHWRTSGKEMKWFVALRQNSTGSIVERGNTDLQGFREIPLPPGTDQMADPFLCEAQGHTYLLFEELPIGSSRGRLSVVEVLADGSCSDMQIVLEQDYHLSYPCVVPSGDEMFLLPESGQAGRVDLYRFTRFPWDLEYAATLVDLPFVDTTPILVDGIWYFFATTGKPFMETFLFWADSLDGSWNLHPCSPISGSVLNSRSAGNLFWRNGRLYRPTQDCSVIYGYAIQVNEVTRLTPTEFAETGVNWIPPTWAPGLAGTHTWNESGRVQVLDAFRWV